MEDEIMIAERNDEVSSATLAALIRKAHTVNLKNNLRYGTADITESELNNELLDSTCYVAYYQNNVVGTCVLSERKVSHWYFNGMAAYIHLLAIDPQFQNKKIGTKLLDKVLCEIDADKKYDFCFMTTAEKNGALRKVCEKLNFHLLWFSTYEENSFYSVTYGKWMSKCPFSSWYIKLRYQMEKCMIKIIFKPGRRFRFWQ